ncbi:MAG: universal stress protein [Candidatus Sulfotelmatobacter sp.]
MPAVQIPARIALKNILFTTDFSPSSEAALPFALAFARLYEASLLVVHVLPPEPHLALVPDRLPAQDEADFEQARHKLSGFVRSNIAADVTCKLSVSRGPLDTVIPELIAANDIDLVVLGSHGRRGLKKVVLGSSAEKIYRSASCPVLTVGPSAHPAASPCAIKRILFPVDLSTGTAHALPYALSLAEENEAELILLHAAPLVPWQHRISVEDRSRAELMRLIPPEVENWCKPVYLVRWEYPPEAILQAAADGEMDLIVMGVNKAREATLSSHRPWPIASEVVSRAPCPVLTVRG